VAYLKFSSIIAEKLVRATGNEDKKDVISYAIEVLVLNLLDIILALLIGAILGVLPGTIICLVTFIFLRSFTGGSHSKSPLACMIITGLIFPFLALTANMITSIPYYIWGLVFLGAFVYVLVKAPVEIETAPILSSTRRNALRYLSIVFLLITATACFTLFKFGYVEYMQCLALTVLWNLFAMSPLGFAFFNMVDRIFIREVKS